MELRMNVKDEHGALGKADRALMQSVAQEVVERYGRFLTDGHLNIHVRTAKNDSKHLTRIKVNLDTDDGDYHAAAEGWGIEETYNDCIDSLKSQLEKRAERLTDRRAAI